MMTLTRVGLGVFLGVIVAGVLKYSRDPVADVLTVLLGFIVLGLVSILASLYLAGPVNGEDGEEDNDD